MQSVRTVEQRLRRLAQRQGLRLTKSHTRNERAIDFGRYFISDPWCSNLLLTSEHGIDLEDAESFLRASD